MRYTAKSGDWVEFKAGLSKQPMSKVLAASNTPSLLAEWIDKCEFRVESEDGVCASPTDGAGLLNSLTFKQWDWLSARLIEWARDDMLDPEA